MTLTETEEAVRWSRRITARLEAYRQALSEGLNRRRVGATGDPLAALHLLALRPERPEVDLVDAAKIYGEKKDTSRKAARERRIEGPMVNDHWRLDVRLG